jgi:hypothetical protein
VLLPTSSACACEAAFRSDGIERLGGHRSASLPVAVFCCLSAGCSAALLRAERGVASAAVRPWERESPAAFFVCRNGAGAGGSFRAAAGALHGGR